MKKTILGSSIAAATLLSSIPAAYGALEEVIVTAQRKEETLQDAAIAIDAVSGDSMAKQGITDIYSLADSVPSLTIAEGGGGSSQLYLRGIGNRTTSSWSDPAIATSYDGVFMGRAQGVSSVTMYDLERVEVLKGPQGTLYGRNATGGAINIIPTKPVLGETFGSINGMFGNFDDWQLQGMINGPAGENSALRLAATIHQRDGYNNDGTQDADNWALRGQFLTMPTDNLSIRVGIDYSKLEGMSQDGHYDGFYAGSPFDTEGYSLVPSGLDIDEGMLSSASNAWRNTIPNPPSWTTLTDIQDDWYVDNAYLGINAEINLNTDLGTFTFIPGYREVNQDSQFGGPGFNSGWFGEEDTQFSAELRLAGETEGLLDYIFGLYYFDEENKGDNSFFQEDIGPLQDYTQDVNSWAAFTQLTWNLTDTTRLVTGLRYTDDEKDFDGTSSTFILSCTYQFPADTTPCLDLPAYPTVDTAEELVAFLESNSDWLDPGTTSYGPNPFNNGLATLIWVPGGQSGSYGSDEVTYRVSFEWDAADDSLVYLTYETGYRTGGFQIEGPTYDPETIKAITLGAKNRFLDGSLQLNVELFHWKYEDQQISYFTVNRNTGATLSLTDNVGQATNQGVDIDIMWQVADNTLLSGKVQYLDNSYDDLTFEAAFPFNNIHCPSEATGDFSTDGFPILAYDCSGSDSIYSPELTFKAGIEQTIPMENTNLILSLDTKYVDEQSSGFFNLPHEHIDSYTASNLDITLESADGDWSVSAYAHNLEDERQKISTQSSPMNLAISVYGAPLTYGMRFALNF